MGPTRSPHRPTSAGAGRIRADGRTGVDRDMRGRRPDPQHVAQGQELRQRSRRGFLWPVGAEVLPRQGLDWGRGGRVLGDPRRVVAVVPLGAHLAGARLAHARRAPACPRICGVGTRKCPQSLSLLFERASFYENADVFNRFECPTLDGAWWS